MHKTPYAWQRVMLNACRKQAHLCILEIHTHARKLRINTHTPHTRTHKHHTHQQLIAHEHVPAVMVDTAWGSLKTGITLRQLSPRVRASGGVWKQSLADSVATKQPLLFKRSQWLKKLRRYDNHTYIHTYTHIQTKVCIHKHSGLQLVAKNNTLLFPVTYALTPLLTNQRGGQHAKAKWVIGVFLLIVRVCRTEGTCGRARN